MSTILESNIHELGVSFQEVCERRITVGTSAGKVVLSTYQDGRHHVFNLTNTQARHLAGLLMKDVEPAETSEAPA